MHDFASSSFSLTRLLFRVGASLFERFFLVVIEDEESEEVDETVRLGTCLAFGVCSILGSSGGCSNLILSS